MNTDLSTCFRLATGDCPLFLPDLGTQVPQAGNLLRDFRPRPAEFGDGLACARAQEILPIVSDGLGRTAGRLAREQTEFRFAETPRFEALLAGILARFARLCNGDADREIIDALGAVSEFLGVDRAGLWCNSAEEAGSL